uniref:Uncharacterized protein n=1 Tax=Schizaphis graminum TaxID=13262 RepID=A0A2S2PDE4_SCHGA
MQNMARAYIIILCGKRALRDNIILYGRRGYAVLWSRGRGSRARATQKIYDQYRLDLCIYTRLTPHRDIYTRVCTGKTRNLCSSTTTTTIRPRRAHTIFVCAHTRERFYHYYYYYYYCFFAVSVCLCAVFSNKKMNYFFYAPPRPRPFLELRTRSDEYPAGLSQHVIRASVLYHII